MSRRSERRISSIPRWEPIPSVSGHLRIQSSRSPRRLAFYGVAAIGAAAIVAGALTAIQTPLEQAEGPLIDAVRAASGLEVATNGRARVSLLPTPRVSIAAVSLSAPGEQPFAVAREVVGAPKLSALLFGRIELDEITLEGAEIALDRAPISRLFANRGAAGLDGPEIRLVDAILTFGGKSIEKVEAGLSWAGHGKPLSVSGFGSFQSRPIEAAFTLTDSDALARGEDAPFRARIEGGGARVTFDGTARNRNGAHLTGDLRARAASLRETLRWFGLPGPRASAPLTGFSLAGHASADKSGVSITDAELGLEGGSFVGAGRLALAGGRPSIEATLDSDLVDLDPYIRGIAPPTLSAQDGWSPKRLDLKPLRGYNLDLRLSADEVRFAGWKLGATAATIAVADGAVDLSIGEANAYRGVVGGRFSLAPEGRGVRMKLQAASTDVDLGRALSNIAGKPLLTGALTSDVSLDGVGASAAEIIAGMTGRGSARVVGGALQGVGRSRTLALAGLHGGMDVDHASAKLTFRRGVAEIDDFSIAGEAAAFSLSGGARLIERDIALRGFVRPVKGEWTLPVKVDGPLSAPKLRPNLSGHDLRGEVSRADGPKSGG